MVNVNAAGPLKEFDVKGNNKKITIEDIEEIVKDDKKTAKLKAVLASEIEKAKNKPNKKAELLELYFEVDQKKGLHSVIKELMEFVNKNNNKNLLDLDILLDSTKYK
jgi:aspartate/glutamate racemase